MKAKLKPCDGECGGLKVIWKNHEGKKYCKTCWKLELTKNSERCKPIRSQKRLPSRSPKRTREEKLYSAKRIIFLSKNPMCQAHLQGCKGKASEVHHKAGRSGTLYLDEEHWLAVCDTCHKWIELHPKEARESGLSESKVGTNDNNTRKDKQ